jgi:hypothetical protein
VKAIKIIEAIKGIIGVYNTFGTNNAWLFFADKDGFCFSGGLEARDEAELMILQRELFDIALSRGEKASNFREISRKLSIYSKWCDISNDVELVQVLYEEILSAVIHDELEYPDLEVPDVDGLCGKHLAYRDLIECGETQAVTQIKNYPVSPSSYKAILETVTNILDPVIDVFGNIRLTYGLCTHDLGKHIKKRVSPKLDQHAAHELNSKGNYICPRLGFAVDFIIENKDMREVADWIYYNTPFDRLYFYGNNKPIHVSFGPQNKKEYVDLIATESGRQVPKVRKFEK